MATPLMTQQFVAPQESPLPTILTSRRPAVELLRLGVMLSSMALEVSGAGKGTVAAGVGAGEPLLARRRRSGSSVRWGYEHVPGWDGMGVGGGGGVGVDEVGFHVRVEAVVVWEGGAACGEQTRIDILWVDVLLLIDVMIKVPTASQWCHVSIARKKKNLPVFSCSSVHRICI